MQVNAQVKVNHKESEHDGRAGVVVSTDAETESSVVRLDESTEHESVEETFLDADLTLLGY